MAVLLRKLLIYTHRWLGIAGSLVFLVWFASGIVMMYQRMPRLTPEERLSRLDTLDLAGVHVSVADAAARTHVEPDRVRIGMVDGRPAYRLLSGGAWATVFADTGEPLEKLSPDAATRIGRRFFPEHAATIRHDAILTEPDQWTLDGGLPRYLPMHRLALGDPDDTYIYISERTGEPVMKTTGRGRFWGYTGAVLHWTYFTPFRQQRELWRYSIIYGALVGCVLCLSGLIVGVWRFSISKRYRLRRVASHSPYAGWMWWHHYAGLLFGLTTFTWALSGALSLTPWDWAPSTAPTAEQTRIASGGPLRLDIATPDALRRAAAAIGASFTPKELDVVQFDGDPVAMATPTALGQPRLALLRGGGTFDRFPNARLVHVATAAMSGHRLVEATWLDEYDAYYYDRRNPRPLPVLRARFDDPDATWLYLDPQSGTIALRHTRLSRLNRWVYHGLHSFDFPGFYYARPAWDIVLIVLSLGGIALTVTTVVPAVRRLRRHCR